MTSQQQDIPAVKPRAIPFSEIEWRRPDWADQDSQALVALVEGYEFEIGPGERKTWDWAVKTTAEVSETPDVLVAGVAKSRSGSQYACKENLNVWRRSEWQRSRGVEPKAKTVQKAPKAEQPVPTEAQMASARKFVDDQLAGPNGRTRKPAAEKPVAA